MKTTKMKEKCPHCSKMYVRLNSHIGSCPQRRFMMEKQIIELQQQLKKSPSKVQNIYYNDCTFTVTITHNFVKDLQKNLLTFGSCAREGIESVAHNYRGIIGARQLIKDMQRDATENGSTENKEILSILQTDNCIPPDDADKETLNEALPSIQEKINKINEQITESIVENVSMSPQEQEEFVKETQKGVFKN